MIVKKILAILAVILILIGIIAGIFLIRRQQNIKSKATLEGTRLEIIDVNGGLLTSAVSRNIKLRLIFVASASATPSSSPISSLIPSPTELPTASPSVSPTDLPTPSPQVIESTGSAVQGIAYAQEEIFPTAYRVANFQSGLEFAVPQVFDQNSKEIPWRLSQGNGQKTVFVQFKVNGVWEEPVSSQITLNYIDPPGPAYGMQIDIRDQAKIPTQAQADLTKPRWVRFVYPCTDVLTPGVCPDDWHKTNLINSIPSHNGVTSIERLAIINGETAWGSPVGSTDVSVWRAYIDDHFLPILRQVVQTDTSISAIELWNEEDQNSDPNVQPYIPPEAFAYLLKSSSALIRSLDPNMNIVSGGIVSSATYLKSAKTADGDAFSDIDALGIHPYVTPDHINDITTFLNSVKQSNLEANINQPYWITEIGIQEFTHSSTPKNQKEFMEKAFDQFVAFSPIPQVVNWYAFTDAMGGSDGSSTWGLFKTDGTIKPAGEFFRDLNNIVLPSPSPSISSSPSASPTATPTPSVSPTPSPTPRPTSTPVASPTPTPKPPKSKDFNGDRKVNAFDVVLLFGHWRSSLAADLDKYDLNGDGVINSFDYTTLRSSFSQ